MANFGTVKPGRMVIGAKATNGGDVRKRYDAMLKRAEKAAMEEAIHQANLNEAERHRTTRLQAAEVFGNMPLMLSDMESYSALQADDTQNRQRKAAGAGGTLKILKNLAQGEAATLSEGTQPGRMAGRSATEYEKRLQEEGKLEEEDKLRALKELQNKRNELGATGFARYMTENPLANPSNWK